MNVAEAPPDVPSLLLCSHADPLSPKPPVCASNIGHPDSAVLTMKHLLGEEPLPRNVMHAFTTLPHPNFGWTKLAELGADVQCCAFFTCGLSNAGKAHDPAETTTTYESATEAGAELRVAHKAEKVMLALMVRFFEQQLLTERA